LGTISTYMGSIIYIHPLLSSVLFSFTWEHWKNAKFRQPRIPNELPMLRQNPGRPALGAPGLSLPSRRLSLNAKSNRTPGGEARESVRAGRMCPEHSPVMAGTAVWEQRLCKTGIVRSQQPPTGITLRASRSDGEDSRRPRSRSRFPTLAAERHESPARPCPAPSASRTRGGDFPSPTALIICCAVHSAVGRSVTLKSTMLRRLCASTMRTQTAPETSPSAP